MSSGAAAVLIGGMASALLVSSRTLAPDASPAADANRAAMALSQLTDDLRNAIRFTERTSQAVTFEAPDRDGDGVVEQIRYSWSGLQGDPLLYQLNGGPAATVAADVQNFSLSALTRTVPATNLGPATTHYVVYETFAEARTANNTTTLPLALPGGVSNGKLLIAAVAIDGAAAASITAPAGWTPLAQVSNSSACGVAVWWRIGEVGDPANHTFAWTGAEKAYGWIMRFAEINPAGPINVINTAIGSGTTAQCPSVTTTVDNTMIVRIGGFDDDDITVDSPGMSGHTSITMDRSGTGSDTASGAAAYVSQAAKAVSGTANFALTAPEEYATVTLAIAPLPPD